VDVDVDVELVEVGEEGPLGGGFLVVVVVGWWCGSGAGVGAGAGSGPAGEGAVDGPAVIVAAAAAADAGPPDDANDAAGPWSFEPIPSDDATALPSGRAAKEAASVRLPRAVLMSAWPESERS